MKKPILFSLFAITAACGGATDAGGSTTMHACTEIGCRSPIAVITGRVALPDATGTHRFDVETDAGTQQCTVEITASDVNAVATCTGDAELSFGPTTQNVEDTASAPGTVSVRVEAIPGEHTWQLVLPGVHRSVRVSHRRGDVLVAEREAAITYREVRPNGPSCEPVCQQATETWDLSP